MGKFICIGLNYADHAAESGLEVPKETVIFGKATSAIIGSNDDVLVPRDSTKCDWEVELDIVIGTPGVYRRSRRDGPRRRILRRVLPPFRPDRPA